MADAQITRNGRMAGLVPVPIYYSPDRRGVRIARLQLTAVIVVMLLTAPHGWLPVSAAPVDPAFVAEGAFLPASQPSISPLIVEPSTIDLGELQSGQTGESVVRLINPTNAPLEIVRVQTSCGCTVADRPQEPIGPGEAFESRIGMRPSRSSGIVRKTIRFYTADATDPVTLNVQATVTGGDIPRQNGSASTASRARCVGLNRKAVGCIPREVKLGRVVVGTPTRFELELIGLSGPGDPEPEVSIETERLGVRLHEAHWKPNGLACAVEVVPNSTQQLERVVTTLVISINGVAHRVDLEALIAPS